MRELVSILYAKLTEVLNTTFLSDTWSVAQRALKVGCPDPERERMGSVINQAYKVYNTSHTVCSVSHSNFNARSSAFQNT